MPATKETIIKIERRTFFVTSPDLNGGETVEFARSVDLPERNFQIADLEFAKYTEKDFETLDNISPSEIWDYLELSPPDYVPKLSDPTPRLVDVEEHSAHVLVEYSSPEDKGIWYGVIFGDRLE